MPLKELEAEQQSPVDEGDNDHINSDGDDARPSSLPTLPQQHQLGDQPRPKLVSFQVPDEGNEGGETTTTTAASPSINDEQSKPRNRRRLYRDMSYTSRAIRRDNYQPGSNKNKRGSKSQPIFAPSIKRQEAISRGSFDANEAAAVTVRDGMQSTATASTTVDASTASSATALGQTTLTPPPPSRIRERPNSVSFRSIERRDHRRGNTGSFRAQHRRGSIAKAGAGISPRFRAYIEDRTEELSTFSGRNNNSNERGSATAEYNDDLHDNSTGRGNTQEGIISQYEQQHSQNTNQYFIPPPEEANKSILDAFSQLYSLAFGDLAMWLYGASFGRVLLFFLVLYMMFVYCFVIVLYLVDRYYTNSICINSLENENGEGLLSVAQHFEFAFELSWTTFTTVGYGNAGPPPELGCYPIRILCSIEAILGMAFVSMCSGLFYAKLLRLLGKAPVTFSSTLCVQYGKGLDLGRTGNFRKSVGGAKRSSLNFDDGAIEVSDEEDEKNDTKEGDTKEKVEKRKSIGGGNVFHPYPVIEFRIVNNRANHAPGMKEIWDCEVTALVQLSIENDPQKNQEGLDEFQINKRTPSMRWKSPSSSSNVNDNNAGSKKSQKVYYKLALKPSSHPYFSRIWFLRHTLDAKSPLLRKEVRDMIKDSKRGWDPSFDNYHDIRACLVEFNSLQVIMSGASALSRSEVFAEKTYTYDDVCVGWRYIAVCYEENSDKQGRWQQCKRRKNQREHFSFGDDTTTRVDLSLIHDIVPQRGGDYEPVEFIED